MNPLPVRSAPLPVIWLANHPDEAARTRCPPCQELLVVQPHSAESTDRETWRGVCPACGGHYALEHVPDGTSGATARIQEDGLDIWEN